MWAGQTRSHAHGEPAPFVPVGAPGDWSRWLSAGGGEREQCGGVGGQCGGVGGQCGGAGEDSGGAGEESGGDACALN